MTRGNPSDLIPAAAKSHCRTRDLLLSGQVKLGAAAAAC